MYRYRNNFEWLMMVLAPHTTNFPLLAIHRLNVKATI